MAGYTNKRKDIKMITILNHNVAENVRRLRQKRGISPAELAASMGVTVQTVNKIESGWGQVSGWTRTRLIAALQIHWCALELPPTLNEPPLDPRHAPQGPNPPRRATIRPVPVRTGAPGHKTAQNAPVAPGIIRGVRQSVFRVWLGNIVDLCHGRSGP
jgi:DNA-binding transcriptional regulator YiaG